MLGAAEQAHRHIRRLMQAGDWRAAQEAGERAIALHPEFARGWLALHQIAMVRHSPLAALAAIDRALRIEPCNADFLVHRAKCLLALDGRQEALQVADAVERGAPADPAIWDSVGTLRTMANDHRGA